ncbi:hypothetical protein NKG05_24795 [Oerskovia sp. M15]
MGTGLVSVPAARPRRAAGPLSRRRQQPPQARDPEVPVDAAGKPLGAVTAVTAAGNKVTLTAGAGAYRVTFLDDETLRVEADLRGRSPTRRTRPRATRRARRTSSSGSTSSRAPPRP